MEIHHFTLSDQPHHYLREHSVMEKNVIEGHFRQSKSSSFPHAVQQHQSSYFQANSTAFGQLEIYGMGGNENRQHLIDGDGVGGGVVEGAQRNFQQIFPHRSIKNEFNNNITFDEFAKYGGMEFLQGERACEVDFDKNNITSLERFTNPSPTITSSSSSSTSTSANTLFDSSTVASSASTNSSLHHQFSQQYSMISHKKHTEKSTDHIMSDHVTYDQHQIHPEPSSSSASIVTSLMLNSGITFGPDRKRPYPCNICPSKFGSKMELEEHQNSHTGMKPFQCDICQSRFNRRSTLWNHKRIHSDAKPFVCTVCQMTFKWKNSLKCHKEMHYRKNETTNILDNDIHQLTYATAAKKQMTDGNGIVFDEDTATNTNTVLITQQRSRKRSYLYHQQQCQENTMQQQLDPLSSERRSRGTISHVKTETKNADVEPTMADICLRKNDAVDCQPTTKQTSVNYKIQQKLAKGNEDPVTSIHQQQQLLFNNKKRITDGQNVVALSGKNSGSDLLMDAAQPLQMNNNNRISMDLVHHTTLSHNGTTKDALARLHDTIDAYAVTEEENRVPSNNNVTTTPARNNLSSTQHFMSSDPLLFSMNTRQNHELMLLQQQHRQDNDCDKSGGVYFEQRQSCCPTTITQTTTSTISNDGRLTTASHRLGHHHPEKTHHHQDIHVLQGDTGGFNFSHSDAFFSEYPMVEPALLSAAVNVNVNQPHPGHHPLAMMINGGSGTEVLTGCNNGDFYYTQPTNSTVPLTSANSLNHSYANY